MFEQIKEAQSVRQKMIDYLMGFYKPLEEHFKEVDSKTQIELMVNSFEYYKRMLNSHAPFTQADFDEFCNRVLTNTEDHWYFKKIKMFRCGSNFFLFKRMNDKFVYVGYDEKSQHYTLEAYFPYPNYLNGTIGASLNKVFIDEKQNIITRYFSGLEAFEHSDVNFHTYETSLLEGLLATHISK